ncbi:hypothetical protein NE237_023382 [Protea cynaroides]|uniref:Uncharacterized protein n=1 Tax=Protea cynaroides TaxID=273540 RepID=A0A9Q0HEU5_9MAGN|nr:hypothetical protein NE237_023382 [Protea cynaroides]
MSAVSAVPPISFIFSFSATERGMEAADWDLKSLEGTVKGVFDSRGGRNRRTASNGEGDLRYELRTMPLKKSKRRGRRNTVGNPIGDLVIGVSVSELESDTEFMRN